MVATGLAEVPLVGEGNERSVMSAIELDRQHRNVAMRRRYEALRRAGFGWGSALRLANARDVDVRAAAELLRRGCPPETALRILL